MKKTAILACSTLKNELECVRDEINCSIPIFYVDNVNHNVPKKLHKSIQEKLDSMHGYERILLLFASCGNAILGLHTKEYELIIPKADDCISLLMGSVKARTEYLGEKFSVFLTEGWLEGKYSIQEELKRIRQRYCSDTAKEITDTMYKEFDWLTVVDTGAYDLKKTVDTCRKLAKELGLELKITKGNSNWIKLLLTGPWDLEHFLIIPPETIVEI